jgi:hypothetical protein
LPDFYHVNLGRALGNQLWLVTHSDSLLRQAVGNPNYSVFHMSAPRLSSVAQATPENQVTSVTIGDELEQAVVSIVGDLAAYKPRAKVVIVEGGGDVEFDVDMVGRLFPSFSKDVNVLPGGSKRRVRDLYEILHEARGRAGLSERFYAIVDRDRDFTAPPLESNVYQWDRYHIENYLLENEYVLAAYSAVRGGYGMQDSRQINAALMNCARSLLERLILERLQDQINTEMIASISVGANPATLNPAKDIRPSITGSLSKMSALVAQYTEDFLTARESEIRSRLEASLLNDEWRREFPGRLVLKRFVSEHVDGVSYEPFRNLIIDKMVDSGFRPPGMLSIIESIVAA